MTYDRWKTTPPDDDNYWDDLPDNPSPEEARAEAWEYWHQRALKAEAALYRIRQLEPGTQQWIDSERVDAKTLLGEALRIANSAVNHGKRCP